MDRHPRNPIGQDQAVSKLVEPTKEQILAYCGADPIERVFLEDVARRGHGRFVAVGDGNGISGLCHLGTNVVPSGVGCGAFAGLATRSGARMIIGEQGAVSDLWSAAEGRLPEPREDRPGQPVYAIAERPEPGGTGLRPARTPDLDLLVPACAAAHQEELGVDPLSRDREGFRWRTRTQIEEGRSWIWVEDDVILFKAEASAWTPSAVQLQQVWTDPPARGQGRATRALRDLIRLLLAEVPVVCLFVRADNEAAIRLYETVGMRRVLSYRSVLL
jgi:RimJ/RimL family protein N-acetyltransferase